MIKSRQPIGHEDDWRSSGRSENEVGAGARKGFGNPGDASKRKGWTNSCRNHASPGISQKLGALSVVDSGAPWLSPTEQANGAIHVRPEIVQPGQHGHEWTERAGTGGPLS